jgi:hypothetical protein
MSRRLRVDEPKLPISLSDSRGPLDAKAAPAIGDDRRLAAPNQEITATSRDLVETPAENSHVIYCGTEEALSEGFAMALRIIGLKRSS